MMKNIRDLIAVPFVALAVALLYTGCYISDGKKGIERVERILK